MSHADVRRLLTRRAHARHQLLLFTVDAYRGAPHSYREVIQMSENRRLLHQMVRPFQPEEDDCPARLRLSLGMMEAGLEMMRLSLQRSHPEDSPQETNERLHRWMLDQPPAPGLRDASYRFKLESAS